MLGLWFLLQALYGASEVAQPVAGEGGVAYFAHIGGFLFGLLVIKLFANNVHEDYERAPPRAGVLMAGRTVALLAALVMIGLIAFLTVGSLMEEDGITAPLAVLSLLILIVIGVGVIGALTHPPDK